MEKKKEIKEEKIDENKVISESEKKKDKIIKFLVFIILLLIVIIGSYYIYHTRFTDDVSGNSTETEVDGNNNLNQGEEKELTVDISFMQGFTYYDRFAETEKTTGVDVMSINYDSDYVNTLNKYYTELSEKYLEENQLVTEDWIESKREQGHSNIDELLEDLDLEINDLAVSSSFDITYTLYVDVISIVGTYKLQSLGGSYENIHSSNINLNDGTEYSNSDMINLFNLTEEYVLSEYESYFDGQSNNDVKFIDDMSFFIMDSELYVNIENYGVGGFYHKLSE
ncbi:MAG: hypothetical protein R3Y13_05080 [bacterium]